MKRPRRVGRPASIVRMSLVLIILEFALVGLLQGVDQPETRESAAVHCRKPRISWYIISSRRSNKRIRSLMSTWGEKIRNDTSTASFNFVSIESPGFEKYSSITVPKRIEAFRPLMTRTDWSDRHGFLVFKNAAILEHCVKNTSADWCMRCCDDLYVHMEGYKLFLRHLASLPDPRTVPMMFGNCLDLGEKWFLQGGSGYVFSRKAVEMFLEFEDDWIINAYGSEDVHLARIGIRLNITSAMADSTFFTGHFSSRDYSGIWNRCRECPERVEPEPYCNHSLIPLRNVAFFHDKAQRFTPEKWQSWLKNVPENAMMYYEQCSMRICCGRVTRAV